LLAAAAALLLLGAVWPGAVSGAGWA